MKLKISKKNIALGILYLTFSFLFILAILEQSLSVEFFKLVIEGMVVLVWIIIPIITLIVPLLLLDISKKSFNFLFYFILKLLFVSNITFLLYLNIGQVDLGVMLIALFVWGSIASFIVALLIALLGAYFVKKNLKELMSNIFTVKIFKSLLWSVGVTFLLVQIYLMGTAIVAYKTMKLTENKKYSLLYFYRPLNLEIRLDNGLRWSYGRVKFVGDGE